MKLRHWLLAFGAPILAFALLRQGASLSADINVNKALTQPSTTAAYLGAGSCSASACHNNAYPHAIAGSEFTLWATRDPHAKAYETLFNETSLTIQRNLASNVAPHEDERCLKCHVSPEQDLPKPIYFKTDGVSCETCHGPAKQWIDVHHLSAWQQRSAAEKQQFGMRDMRSALGRVKTCLACHVGLPGMEVNHDLIAAGHPRLSFEFAAFHEQMPRHWPDEKDRKVHPDFEARLWVVGQLASAHAALELLAHRAEPKQKVWPEFAEHDCAACHHHLSGAGSHDLGKAKPGALSWGGSIALVESAVQSLDPGGDPKLSEALAKLRAAFDSGKPNREVVTANAKAAASRLTVWLDEFDRRTMHAKWFEKVSDALAAERTPRRDSDAATNHLLAVIALRKARTDAGWPTSSDDRLDDLLRTSQKSRRTISYEPAAIRERLRLVPR